MVLLAIISYILRPLAEPLAGAHIIFTFCGNTVENPWPRDKHQLWT